MAKNQAFANAIGDGDKTITKQKLLQKIVDLTSFANNASYQGGMNAYGIHSGQNEKVGAHHEANQLKALLGYLPDDSAGSSWSNPFGASGGGAPQVSTDNRFASGLTDAEGRLRSLLDNPDSINQSSAYKFRVGQGQEALQRSLGARGLLNSGNRLMELTKYGQDMGSQEYDAQYGRLSNLLGNYSTGYSADKNANTNLFSAQANAWNTAQGNQDENMRNERNIWAKRTPIPIPGQSGGYWKA